MIQGSCRQKVFAIGRLPQYPTPCLTDRLLYRFGADVVVEHED